MFLKSDKNHIGSSILKLIDFGFAQKYKDENGVHQKCESTDSFTGNIAFSSLNQMELKSKLFYLIA